MFEKVFRTIFGPENDDILGSCRVLHNDELYDLYEPLSIARTTKCRKPNGLGLYLG